MQAHKAFPMNRKTATEKEPFSFAAAKVVQKNDIHNSVWHFS